VILGARNYSVGIGRCIRSSLWIWRKVECLCVLLSSWRFFGVSFLLFARLRRITNHR